jgi:hypothetical protein
MLSSTIRPAAVPMHREYADIDNPTMTRLLQVGIAAVMGTTLVVFHSALLAVATAALPFA